LKAAVNHNRWTFCEKATHLLDVFQRQAADILQRVLVGATHEYIVALKGHYGDHQLAAAYRVQLKATMQLNGNSLQELAAAVEQLAHWALEALPVDFIQREVAHAFIDGLRDRELKYHLLISGDTSLNEALNETRKLEAAMAAAGPPARMRKVTRASVGTRLPPSERRGDVRPVCWQCRIVGHFSRVSTETWRGYHR
jgi:hypothetical protein